MNRKDWTEALIFAGLRIMAVMLIIGGLLGVVFQLMESWSSFDPSYFWQFVSSTMLRPLILVFTGLGLSVMSGWLSRHLSAGHRG